MLCVAASLFLLIGQQVLVAADISWTGGGVITSWTTPLNWSGNAAPTATDNALFSSTFTNQPTVDIATSVGGVWMKTGVGQNVTIGGTAALTLMGNTINGTPGLGILVDNTSAFTLTINAPLTLGATQTWTNSSNNLLTVGAVNLNSFGLTVNGAGNSMISGVISGTGPLSKSGAGTLTLNGANMFTGTVTVQNGTLSFGGSALGNSANAVVLGGSGTTGTLQYTGAGGSSTRNYTMAVGGTGLFDITSSGATFSISSAISGSGNLAKSGAGTLSLSGANTYGGATIINAGKLSLTASGVIPDNSAVTVNGTFDLGGGGSTAINETIGSLSGSGIVDYTVTQNNRDGTLTVGNNNASTTFSGVLQNTSNLLSLTKTGTGTLTLSGANTYSGVTTVNAGVLRLDNTSALGAGNLNLNGGVLGLGAGNFIRAVGTSAGQVQLNVGAGFAAYNADRIVNLGGASATMTWASTAGFLTTGATLILGATDADRTLTFQNPINFNTAVRTIQVNDGSAAIDATLSGVLSGTGASGFIKTGAGTLFLTGANTFSGNVTINAGTLGIISGVLGNGALTINAGTLEVMSTINTTRSISLGDATSTFQIDPSYTYTLTNPVSGTGTLNKTGAGILALSGANTYSGGTVINAGTIIANSSGSLGASGVAATINAGTLDISATFSAARNFVLGNAASTIMVDPSQTFTVGTVISGSGSLNKSGTGILQLDGVGTYTGATNVTAGTISLGPSASLASTALNVSAGATFTGNATASLPSTLAVTADGAVNLSSSARTIASLNGASSGVVTLNSTNLSVGSGSYAGVVQNGAGAGSLTKTGGGTLTLTGASTYTGSTTVNGGTLTVAATSGSALGSTGSITVNSGGSLLLGANNQINNTASVTLAGGTFAKGNFTEGSNAPATTNTPGVGALTLTATGSHLDFGAGTTGALTFASFTPRTFTLSIDNWSGTANTLGSGTTDRLIFNTSLSAAQLSFFSFTGYAPGATQFDLGNGFYEITPVSEVPEPATYLAAAFALLAVGYHRARSTSDTALTRCPDVRRCAVARIN